VEKLMVRSSSKANSRFQKSCGDNSTPEPIIANKAHEQALPGDIAATRRLYFVNEIVEWQLTQYIWTGCTRVVLRDQIMSNATELIRQIIRKQGLHTIYPGQDESSFGDLLNTAWCQIERTLYKYRGRPHCRICYNPERPGDSLLYEPDSREYGIKTIAEVIAMHKVCPSCSGKLSSIPIVEPIQGRYGGSETILYRGMSKVFNMWSQIARTVILAYIKKEARDRKNSNSYVVHLDNKPKPTSDIIIRFLAEARDMCQYHDDFLKILNALEWLICNDDRPYDGIIGKLVDASGLSRPTVTNFMRFVKLRSLEFTDSPMNKVDPDGQKSDRRKQANIDFDEE
jgi:hypothetical protein